ncbi:MAG: hypothetical protein LIO93_11465, partial [Bacteroidales bacterium]|nr:hypothetical protein [Bacteroidales bacterium]
MYKAVDSNGATCTLTYFENENENPLWEMSRLGETSTALGQINDNRIGENAIKNENNPLAFVLTADIQPILPTISTPEKEVWYYLQFNNGKGVITDMGNNENLKTQHLKEGDESQHWKIIETDNPTGNFKYNIINKNGRVIAYSTDQLTYGIYLATNDPVQALPFALVETTNRTYKPGWELSREGSTRHLTQNVSAGIDRLISEAARNNSRNPILFIELDQAVPTSIFNPAEENHSDTRFKVEEKTLKVEGKNISQISIYTITGQLLNINTQSFSFTFPGAGYYLVSVKYDNNSVYNRK